MGKKIRLSTRNFRSKVTVRPSARPSVRATLFYIVWSPQPVFNLMIDVHIMVVRSLSLYYYSEDFFDFDFLKTSCLQEEHNLRQ